MLSLVKQPHIPGRGPGRPPKRKDGDRYAAFIERAKKIIEARLNNQTLQQIGTHYGISRERVRQVLAEYAYLCPPEKHKFLTGYVGHYQKLERDKAIQKRRDTKKALKRALENNFNRAAVIRLTGWPDIGSDLDICQRLFDEFSLRSFGSYTYCCQCKTVKPNIEIVSQGQRFPCGLRSSRCLKCIRENTAKYYEAHPYPQNTYKNRIYVLRHYYRQRGQPEKMPPLPPKGHPCGSS